MVQVTANYTVLDEDVIVEAGTLSAPITITLPASFSQNRGKFFLIKDISSTASTNPILIKDPSGSIDGFSSYTLSWAAWTRFEPD